jgi:hypothetical protein
MAKDRCILCLDFEVFLSRSYMTEEINCRLIRYNIYCDSRLPVAKIIWNLSQPVVLHISLYILYVTLREILQTGPGP